MTTTRLREVELGPRALDVVAEPDGTFRLRSPEPLGPYPRSMTDRLVQWAATRPERVFLAERAGNGWRTITYVETLERARRIAAGLLARGCNAEHGVAILSENGIDHALVALAAQFVGIPYVPVSPPYALLSTDFVKLSHVLATFAPRLVFAADGERYARALAGAAIPPAADVLTGIDALLAAEPSDAVSAANAALGPDTVAKILFTSGSTGVPKGVINTQRMLCANQQMNVQTFPFLARELVMADWSPWSHTAGSNQIFNMVLYNGGTLYVDDGKPTPADFPKTVRTLGEIATTVYFNIPRGFEELARALEADAALRRTFFSRLQLMWYAAAALAPPVFARMRALAIAECGEEIVMTSGLGATETAPSAFFANWHSDVSGNIGIPQPGIEVKLVPVGVKLEVRLRGPNITPGYLHRDDLTAAAFDDEGFYKMGDALRPLDPADFTQGFLFDGRIGEDFKLSTGTWVSVGPLRTALLAELQPVVRDLVVCGHDRAAIALLLVPSDPATAGDPAARDFVTERLTRFAEANPGSSRHPARALFLDSPPSLDAGEMTDKGSLNSAALRERRRPLVERLYAQPHPAEVLGDFSG